MIYVRALEQKDWELFKNIRLEAVKLHEGLYLSSYAGESTQDEAYWRDILVHDNKRVFGLFDGDCLIGIGAAFTDKSDSSRKTAVLAMGYIKESYRGRKLSRLIYEARIGWAKESGLFDRIVVSHREGNEASRNANQAFGFQLVGERTLIFGNGEQGKDYDYEMRLR